VSLYVLYILYIFRVPDKTIDLVVLTAVNISGSLQFFESEN
jgi:hypothetical protein